MRRRWAVACAALGWTLACGGDGSGGSVSVDVDSAVGCQAIGLNPFPPDLALLGDGSRGVALSFDPPAIVPLDLDGDVPRVDPGVPILGIPDDSDGDGAAEGSLAIPDSPKLDGVFVRDPDLAAADLGLATASDYEEVMVFDPDLGELVEVEVEVDAGFDPDDFRRLPAPGASALRTAVSTDACVRPLEPIDSNGEDYSAGIDPAFFCDPAVAGSFYASFTSGAAVAAARLFVSMSNLGSSVLSLFLPGAVLVYDTDLTSDPPWLSPATDAYMVETRDPAALGGGPLFNPTHVDRLATAGRELVLVTLSGAIGIQQDDPDTPDIELGALPLSPAGLQVLDPETLTMVAGTGPVADGAFGFGGVAVHPSGRVGVVGSVARKSVFVVDLQPLDDLTTPGDVYPAPLLVSELAVPALAGGPSPAVCPGATSGVAFNDAGDRLYVSERCDGSLTEYEVTLPAVGDVDAGDFALLSSTTLQASLDPDNFGLQRDPSVLRVRAGEPGVDYRGPDVFFLSGQPTSQACALRLESL
ncbi:MAG: hypothetical protein ACQGVC_16625 [Myxococcota bacterium]